MFWSGFRRVFALGLWLAAAILLQPGCGKSKIEELPKTYTVKGKLVSKAGKPMAGAEVTFSSVADPELRAYGVTADDGTFTLDSIGVTKQGRSEKQKGAFAGEFLVNVRPGANVPIDPANPPSGRSMVSVLLKKKYKIEPKQDNDITVIVE